MPAPIYSGYEPIIHLNGAKIVYLDTTETNFLPCPEKLAKLITNKTKAIILNYPSNPTGMTLTKDLMDRLVAVLDRHDSLLFQMKFIVRIHLTKIISHSLLTLKLDINFS